MNEEIPYFVIMRHVGLVVVNGAVVSSSYHVSYIVTSWCDVRSLQGIISLFEKELRKMSEMEAH